MLRTFGAPPLFVEATGAWPPQVVGLHGWGRDRADLARVFDGLPAASVDLPGFGMTPPPEDAWGTQRYAERVATFLEELPEPVVVVGHSFGGRVAVRLASARPELVRALVLTGAPIARREHPGRRPPLPYRLIRRAHRAGLISEGVLERGRQRYGSVDYATAQGIMRSVLVNVLPEEYDEDLARIDQPVVLVWGEHDADVPLEVAQRACDALANARLIITPDAGHGLPWERPEALRAAISEVMSA